MEWVDITSRLTTPVYTTAASCPDLSGIWDGWSGLSGSATKTLSLSGDRWVMSGDQTLEGLGCEHDCGGCSGGGQEGGIYRLPAIALDAPIGNVMGVRVRVQLTSGMTASWQEGFEPGLLVLDTVAAAANEPENFAAGQPYLQNGELSIADVTSEQVLQALFDTPVILESVGAILSTGACVTECGYALHGYTRGGGDPAPYWAPLIRVWAFTDPESDFWTDLVNCQEVVT